MSELHVGVGSLNTVKIAATERAFTEKFPKATIIVHGFNTKSGVVAQPLSKQETFKGAKNRASTVAKYATKNNPRLSFAVGLEGGIDLVHGNDMYELMGCAWIIELGSLAICYGSSVGIPVPASLSRRLVETGEEIAPVMTEVFGDDSLRSGIGTNGFLTNGDYVREQEFYDATSAALTRFVNPAIFNSQNYSPKTVRYTE